MEGFPAETEVMAAVIFRQPQDRTDEGALPTKPNSFKVLRLSKPNVYKKQHLPQNFQNHADIDSSKHRLQVARTASRCGYY